MKISIGADHRGFALKEALRLALPDVVWFDVGTESDASCDYPLFAQKAVKTILDGQVSQAILICASGIGMAMAANRYKKIHAAVCQNSYIAQAAKEDDNMNVLVLPADFVTVEQALGIFKSWQVAQFKDGKYARRLDLLDS